MDTHKWRGREKEERPEKDISGWWVVFRNVKKAKGRGRERSEKDCNLQT